MELKRRWRDSKQDDRDGYARSPNPKRPRRIVSPAPQLGASTIAKNDNNEARQRLEVRRVGKENGRHTEGEPR